MPTAGLLFVALIALYIAASGKAQKVLEALGAKSGSTTNAIPDTSGQGTPTGGTEGSQLDLMGANAAFYNRMLTNPGSFNTNSDNPLYQTNYGIAPTAGNNDFSMAGYFGDDPNNGYLGPPISGNFQGLNDLFPLPVTRG